MQQLTIVVDLLFDITPSIDVKLEVLDSDGTPDWVLEPKQWSGDQLGFAAGGKLYLRWAFDDFAGGDVDMGTVRKVLSIPLTVKFRLGLRHDEMSYIELGKICEASGVAAVAMHARTAKQMFRGEAEYDAAAALITMASWDRATGVLEQYRRDYPDSEFAEEINQKLAVTYMETGRGLEAAGEFERIAVAETSDDDVRREALGPVVLVPCDRVVGRRQHVQITVPIQISES